MLLIVDNVDLKLLYFDTFFCLDKTKFDKEYKTVVFFSKEIWMNFKSSYSNPVVLKKSLWYIMGMAAYIMVNQFLKCIVLILLFMILTKLIIISTHGQYGPPF